uniref:AVL9 homolog (S. cerevisiase) n=1 Tax=Callorhinchus milii TaxID=7868 RepID=A0A4W3IXL2_CALMI
HSLPEEWKYLPFLALPDGAHNYQEDTIYFHLPPRSANRRTVYGISCYRQIEAKALKVRQADVTRETVQKSVCVLSSLPLYGLLQAKLQLITHAYFEEKDFSQISILKELYDHMNGSLGGNALEGSQACLGNVILKYLSFQLLFYVAPVNRLVGTLMTVLSLFPGMVEHGLADSSQYKPRKSTSEDISLQELSMNTEEYVSISEADILNPSPEFNDGQHLQPPQHASPNSSESDWETLDPSILDTDNGLKEEGLDQIENSDQKEVFSAESGSIPVTVQPQANTGQTVIVPGLISGLEEDQYGMPLAIFTKGYLCLPYMALQQHHLLSDVTVRGYVAGATNILFRQQKHLSDAIIDVEEARIQFQDPELRKLLNLTTADLRFADYLVKHVTENRDDVFLDGTGWEGGDEWIRAQFTFYVHSLLATTLQPDNEKMLADYGASFITAWKNTHNFRVWYSNKHPAITEINPGHPFQGQYNVSDVKLRFSHSVQNSERGKKLGNAMVSTSRSVVQTGKAVGQSVGEALTSAKSAMSSWFSTFNQQTAAPHTERQTGKQ